MSMLFLLGSCVVPPRYITERYIKNRIEQHTVGEQSEIKMWWIFDNQVTGDNTYTEFVGYEYNGERGLVIGADWLSNPRDLFLGDNTISVMHNIIQLDMAECKAILDNYSILLQKSRANIATKNEFVYHDYTVNEELFISFRTRGSKTGMSSTSSQLNTIIDFWIRGDKYLVNGKQLVKGLGEFIGYSSSMSTEASVTDSRIEVSKSEFDALKDSLIEIRAEVKARDDVASSLYSTEWNYLVNSLKAKRSSTTYEAKQYLSALLGPKPITLIDIKGLTLKGNYDDEWRLYVLKEMITIEKDMLNGVTE